jgi:glycosyltransferase involved in cell wall biosynthesis
VSSVVIAAHNEAPVIERCLAALTGEVDEVVVVPNGCTDDTAGVARRCGATVVELAEPSKAAALNAGDAAAKSFPRLYVDADVVLDPGSVPELLAALVGGALVAVPRRRMDLHGRPWPVRAYYSIHADLPATHNGLYGRGVIALTEAARERFDTFPAMVADDLFLDSRYQRDEIAFVPASVQVAAPTRTVDLVRRLARVRAGNAAMRATSTQVRRARRLSWLRDVVLASPRRAPDAACYVVLTLAAAALAKRRRRQAWGRDDSSRLG